MWSTPSGTLPHVSTLSRNRHHAYCTKGQLAADVAVAIRTAGDHRQHSGNRSNHAIRTGSHSRPLIILGFYLFRESKPLAGNFRQFAILAH